MPVKTLLPALLLVFGLLCQAQADTVALAAGHPQRYTVVKGDTLWDIAARFLRDPWLWPEIWYDNPEIANPHLIYPGDEIVLSYLNGKPRISIRQGRPTVKLSPRPRVSMREKAIPTIPGDTIKQFLTYPRVIGKREINDSAYIIASDEGRLISGAGDKIYARGLGPADHGLYGIFHIGKVYRDPDKGGILGYEAVHVGDARVERPGDPATLTVTRSMQEVLTGDRLMSDTLEGFLDMYFLPHAPEKPIEGRIISVLNGVSRIGQYHTVVLNLGKQDGMESGHVLAIYQTGEKMRDTIERGRGGKVKLPDERAGLLMVVHPFERVSYALIMEATRDMRIRDTVRNP